jgi:hypothetical protein
MNPIRKPHETKPSEVDELFEDIREEFKRDRVELAGPGASPLEKVLADRVVLCRLVVNLNDMVSVTGDGPMGRHMDRIHRRLLTACKALAQVRRLTIPIAIQVNARSAQVNIGAPE